jgi:iron-sulfur cluster assembly protein
MTTLSDELQTATTNNEPALRHDIVGVTPAALVQFQKILEEGQETVAGIRLGVSGGGCAGLQYVLEPTASFQPGDLVQEPAPGIRFYIHPMAAPYLKGTVIDFSTSLMDGGFRFQNPNAANTCGCGTSFGV